jgi:hypothetical protein
VEADWPEQEKAMSSTFGILCSGAFLLLVVYVIVQVIRGSRLEHQQRYHRPIICVCRVDGRVGIVLRKDYESASHQYWKPYYDGKEDYDAGHIMAPCGRRLEVSKVFVFEPHSREYYTICYECYVEQAMFEVPWVPKENLNPIGEAWQYLHKRPWSGHLITW